MHKGLSIFFALFLVAIFLNGCLDLSHSKGDGAEKIRQIPPIQVRVVDVNKRDIPIELTYPARAKSTSSINVKARVQGVLLKKYYTEGEFVKAGELLYLIDPSIYEAKVKKAKANVALRDAEFDRAKKEWDRVELLFKEGAVSKKDREYALSAFESAKAALDMAYADLKDAEINLGYTKVRAPISGIVGQKQQDIGTLVGPGTDNITLTTITTLNPMYAEFSMPSNEALMLNPNASSNKISYPSDKKIRATISDENGNIVSDSGILDFSGINTDLNTGSIKARVIFENKNSSVYPGMFIRVTLKGLVKKERIVIPQKAIMQIPTGTFVYTVVDKKAVFKPIRLGEMVDSDMCIVEEGLNQGDKVIISNILKLKPNAPVQVIAKPLEERAQKGGR